MSDFYEGLIYLAILIVALAYSVYGYLSGLVKDEKDEKDAANK